MTVLDLEKYQAGQPDLIYHYTTAQNAAAILESRVLRLSSLKGLNDPRESKEYVFPIRGNLSIDMDEVRVRLKAISDLVQSNVYVASFTIDETDAPYVDGTGQAPRGFARARNWDQYADHHRGAVLALDRQVRDCLIFGVSGSA